MRLAPTPLLLLVPILGLLALGCEDKGLHTARPAGKTLVLSRAGTPTGLEIGSESAPFPLGLPSALKGRSTFTRNCASCHGTYITAAESQELAKQAALPPSHADFGLKAKELAAEGRWPVQPRRSGPDFANRDWRFQRTPSQLFRLIAYGQAPAMEGNPAAGSFQHPGPSGRMGEGWLQSIKDYRGDQLVAAGDPGPIWNVIFYAWSRAITAVSPTNFKDVWDLYGQNCSVCHGDTAQGNGPLAHTLNPSPFNFSDRKALAESTDAFLFWRISEGGQFKTIPASVRQSMSAEALQQFVHQWSAMPSWRGVLSEEKRWMLVDGVRSKTYEHE